MTMTVSRSTIGALACAMTVACAAASAQSVAGAGKLSLLAAAPQDQIATRLHAPAAGKLAVDRLDHAPVSVSWALDPAQALDARPQPFVRDSREFWIDASEAELQSGVKLALSAPGAVIRISPHAGSSNTTIEAHDIVLRSGGRSYSSAEATRSIVDEAALSAAGMDAPQGSIAMRLADMIGAGNVELSVPTAHGSYLVHVFEPASAVVLKLGADRDSVNAGAPVRIRASLDGGIGRISGLISAPDGASQNLEFARQGDGSYVASVMPDLAHAGDQGLWEVHTYAIASGKNAIQRDAKTAFAVGVPVARFDGSAERDASTASAGGIAVNVGVESIAPSRYQVSAVLYGRASDGSLKPAAIAQSATWLASGHGAIALRYDADSLAKSGLQAPYELRDLRLVNQADMSLLERRERALTLAN
ncbi:MAG: DUF4785 domain-containing protein [Dokdonella sp.]